MHVGLCVMEVEWLGNGTTHVTCSFVLTILCTVRMWSQSGCNQGAAAEADANGLQQLQLTQLGGAIAEVDPIGRSISRSRGSWEAAAETDTIRRSSSWNRHNREEQQLKLIQFGSSRWIVELQLKEMQSGSSWRKLSCLHVYTTYKWWREYTAWLVASR